MHWNGSKKVCWTVFFVSLIALMLVYSRQSVYFALTGLNLWFLKMVPALLPFMILSGIMVRMNLTEMFAGIVYPVLYPLFRVSRNAAYCIVMGFLCGFPMGAKVITELYERQKLSEEEAEFLLSFCNNIGPVYFVGFVLPTLNRRLVLPYALGMYGLPLLYGLFLRYTRFRHMKPASACPTGYKGTGQVSGPKAETILFHVDDAISAAVDSITALGGYMILFDLLNLFPHALFTVLHRTDILNSSMPAVINGLLEVTSGINRLGAGNPLFVLLLLPFGGFSCIAQTYSIIRRTKLSLSKYVLHKICLVALTFLYYTVWMRFLPGSYLQ